MNKKLIAQLAEGKVILDNSSYSNGGEDARAIILAAFGNNTNIGGISNYYFKDDSLSRGWRASDNRLSNLMPSCAKYVKASEFLKEDEEEFVWGEDVVYVNSNQQNHHRYKYVAKHPYRENLHIIVSSNNNSLCVAHIINIKKLPSIKEVTLKEVAEKFGIPVEQIRIKE